MTIEIPALRHRREDIPLLAARFLAESRARHPGSPVERFAPDAMARLLDHAWPGNVRELAHAVERVVLLGREPEVHAGALPAATGEPTAIGLPSSLEGAVLPIREVQRRYAAWALERLGGHTARTAEALEVDTKTLAKWLTAAQDDKGS